MRTTQSRYTITLVGLVAGAILLLAAAGVLCQMQFAKVQQLCKLHDVQEKMFTDRAAELQNNDEQGTLDDMKGQLAKLDKNLADYRYFPTYLQQIQSTTQQTGNVLVNIQPSELKPLKLENSPFAKALSTTTPAATPAATGSTVTPAEGPKYNVRMISLDVLTTYPNLIRLLDAFRQFPKMIYVSNITYSPQLVGTQRKLAVHLQTYVIITPDQYQTEANSAARVEGSGR